MKRKLLSIAVSCTLVLVLACAPGAARAQTNYQLRVMTWNIKGACCNMSDVLGRMNNLRYGGHGLDVICLQECSKDQVKYLVGELKWKNWRFVEAKNGWGNGIICRYRFIAATGRGKLLPQVDDGEIRNIKGVKFNVSQRPVWVFNTHVSPHAAPGVTGTRTRARQTARARDFAGGNPNSTGIGPYDATLVCGDFNDVRNMDVDYLDSAWKRMDATFEDTWYRLLPAWSGSTVPTCVYENYGLFGCTRDRRTVNRRIDYIWRKRNSLLTPISIGVDNQADMISDHLPVFATFRVETLGFANAEQPKDDKIVQVVCGHDEDGGGGGSAPANPPDYEYVPNDDPSLYPNDEIVVGDDVIDPPPTYDPPMGDGVS
ncbi:MAG: endonuclease/exonuclease/phosphatase family protein [Candidatus Sumerlaeaceae bacterium]